MGIWGRASLRHAALATAAFAVVTGIVGGAGATAPPTARAGGPSRAAAGHDRLAKNPDGTTSVDVELTPLARRAPGSDVVLSGPVATSPFTMAGVTWDGGAASVRLRVRRDGSWRPWQTLDPLRDGPDRRSGEGVTGLRATDVQWVGSADGVQVALRGPAVRDAELHLIGTGSAPAAAHAAPSPSPRRQPRPRRHTLRPHLHGRQEWHADPSLRSGRPTYDRTIQQVHVHHTVNSNDYDRADVPGLLRGIYRYHTRVLGWSDIGYNFLVDRFGRIWVGRAGGAGRAVHGAHTLGFNSTSTGVAVVGDFQIARPPSAVVRAIARLAAWKLSRYHRDPLGTVRVFSQGSDRFPRGETVRLPTLDGHRDTNETACPGIHLYQLLPQIRRRAHDRIVRFRHRQHRGRHGHQHGRDH